MNPESPQHRQQLTSRQNEETEQIIHTSQEQAKGVEFASVEEMLRFDSEQHPVPPSVAEKVKESIQKENPPETGWWRRLFSR